MQQMPGWAVITLLVALAVWTVVASAAIEARMLAWWVARSAGSTGRTVGVTALLHGGLTLWSAAVLMSTLARTDPLAAGSWGSGLLAVGLVATVAPLAFPFFPNRFDMGPAHEDLSDAGASTGTARAIRWTSMPFAAAEMTLLVAAVVMALLV